MAWISATPSPWCAGNEKQQDNTEPLQLRDGKRTGTIHHHTYEPTRCRYTSGALMARMHHKCAPLSHILHREVVIGVNHYANFTDITHTDCHGIHFFWSQPKQPPNHSPCDTCADRTEKNTLRVPAIGHLYHLTRTSEYIHSLEHI